MKVYSNSGSLLMEAAFLVYAQDGCLESHQIKETLRKRGISFLEIKVHGKNKATVLSELSERYDRTFQRAPLVFNGTRDYVGGYKELCVTLGDEG